jgi:hypothetical protein
MGLDPLHKKAVTENDPDVYLNKAKALVEEHYLVQEDELPLAWHEIYVVWFSKTLQNWKALLSTSRNDGLYFEVTYDGAKKQAYVDSYIKIANSCVTDEAYANLS